MSTLIPTEEDKLRMNTYVSAVSRAEAMLRGMRAQKVPRTDFAVLTITNGLKEGGATLAWHGTTIDYVDVNLTVDGMKLVMFQSEALLNHYGLLNAEAGAIHTIDPFDMRSQLGLQVMSAFTQRLTQYETDVALGKPSTFEPLIMVSEAPIRAVDPS